MNIEKIKEQLQEINSLSLEEKIDAINEIRKILHELSPFSDNPVDLVLWVNQKQVVSNDYNPNSVAPPEMVLLERSIREDGYTQPIVSWTNEEGMHEVVDGFHRSRVGKEVEDIKEGLHGYLPVTIIRDRKTEKGSRISSTIRHNRARGTHSIDGMANIIIDLTKRNWSKEKIGKELGMDPDEVLRLSQITGLAELFADRDFSKSWDMDEIESQDIELDEEQLGE